MRTQTAARALLLAMVLAGPASLAGRRPDEFQEPTQMTEEDFANARDAKRGKLTGYNPGIVEEKPKEIPWMFIILAGICITAAAPFALSMYAKTARDIKPTSSAVKSGMDETPN